MKKICCRLTRFIFWELMSNITALQRQIEATDKQIDQLVYQLYGLTEDEIRIVEGEIK